MTLPQHSSTFRVPTVEIVERRGLRSRIGLLLGPAIFIAMMLLPAPAGMPLPAWRIAAAAALMVVWWVSEAVPIPITALLPLVLFPLLGLVPIAGAASPYANPVIFLFLGGFIIAIALERCGLHKRMALGIIRGVGTRPARLIAGFMGATAFISMWVSNTATVLMMLPMAVSVADLVASEHDKHGTTDPHFPTALLLGVAYSSSIGGLGTIIGTPPNALLAGVMLETYGIQIGFLEWMLVGVPLVVLAIPLAWLWLTRAAFPVSREQLTGGREIIDREVVALGPIGRAEVIVGGITALTALAWVTRPVIERVLPGLNDTTIAIIGATLMFVVPTSWKRGEFPITWRQAEQLPWGALILFGGGLSLANGFQVTGLSTWLGELGAQLDFLPLIAVAALITLVVLFLTELTSNTATAATFLPIVAAMGVGMGAGPLLFAIPAALAASCAFMLPVATAPNAIVYATERVTIPQMARAGVALNLLLSLIIILITFTMATRVFAVG
jgi:solute carrier family 13 (sodium-dependent dicarboxylate transporter), member 2/3/5